MPISASRPTSKMSTISAMGSSCMPTPIGWGRSSSSRCGFWAAGLPLGRPKGIPAARRKLDAKEAEIRSYLAKGISKRSIAKLVECAPSTLYEMTVAGWPMRNTDTGGEFLRCL
jgi:hypothetical protein